MSPTTITVTGLILDILGAVLLWVFGIADAMNTSGFKPAIGYPPTDAEKAEIKRRVRISRIALGLIIAGFALQLWGTVASRLTAVSVPAESRQGK